MHRFPPTEASRLALFGGVYGNRKALEAVLADTEAAEVGARGCCGDVLGGFGDSDRVLDLVAGACWAWIAGNHEHEAARGSADCGCGFACPVDAGLTAAVVAATVASLSPARQPALAALPTTAILPTPGGDLLLCHGSPERQNEFLRADEDGARLLAWLDQYGCVGLVASHTGVAWLRDLGDGRFAANCGSAGRPEDDGDPRVTWLLATWDGAWHLALQRTAYDHQAAASDCRARGIDPRLSEQLVTGRWAYGREAVAGDLALRAAGRLPRTLVVPR